MKKPIDPVVIRVWNDAAGDVFALLPTIPADIHGRFCTAFQHVGQHCAADYSLCIAHSRPATEAEAAALLVELRGRDYNPRVYRRATAAMHEIRQRLAAA